MSDALPGRSHDTTDGFLLPAVPVTSLADYRAAGGGRGLERARELGPDQTIAEVRLARLRGRGGAGFPTGAKWASVRTAPGDVRYVAVNAAEGEPGTFKDRALMRASPYQLLEGLAIAALAVGAQEAFVAVKHTFSAEIAGLTRAIDEMAADGWFDVAVSVVLGPDEYLFGEEKAMLEVIEGNAPLPRLLPPYQQGLFATGVQLGWQAHDAGPGTPTAALGGGGAAPGPGPGGEGAGQTSEAFAQAAGPAGQAPRSAGQAPRSAGQAPRSAGQAPGQANPTLVNNVETLCNVPHILANGAEWFRGFGTEQSPGIVVATVVGDVAHAGVAEVELGVSLRDVIDLIGGGPRPGRTLKAAFSGISNPVLTGGDLDTPLTYEDFAAIGNGLGAAGFIVYDDSACMVEVARLFSQFLYVESCGQCPACKLGTQAITERLDSVELGRGTDLDIETIGGRLRTVTDANRCALPVEEQNIVASVLRAFPEEFVDHLEGRGCPRPRALVMPKLVDIVDGEAVYDEHYELKQPDWTYADGAPAEA